MKLSRILGLRSESPPLRAGLVCGAFGGAWTLLWLGAAMVVSPDSFVGGLVGTASLMLIVPGWVAAEVLAPHGADSGWGMVWYCAAVNAFLCFLFGAALGWLFGKPGPPQN